MKTILHLSADFPDPMGQAKTWAVRNLVDAASGYRHIVYSLNRVSWSNRIVGLPFGPDRYALAYGAPPRGLLHKTRLEALGAWIAADLSTRGDAVDLVHAHKFSIEGIAAAELSRRLGVPFMCNLWGNTDLKVMRARRDLGGLWRSMTREAAALAPCAPWITSAFADRLPLDRTKVHQLPIIVRHDALRTPVTSGQPAFAMLINLDFYKPKGLAAVAEAVALMRVSTPGVRVDVFGGGKPESVQSAVRMLARTGVEDAVHLMGPIDQSRFQEILGGYCGVLMPSSPETFGMVYLEALFAGAPVMHAKGRAIDGCFPNAGFCRAVDHASVAEIASQMAVMIREEARLKEELRGFQEAGGLETFTGKGVAASYRAIVDAIA